MQNLVVRVRVNVERDLPVHADPVHEVSPGSFRGRGGLGERHILGEALEHPFGGPEGAAGGADNQFAVERDFAVVVGDHHETPAGIALEPGQQLVAVFVLVAVAVVGVEENDAVDIGRDVVAAVEVAEQEAAAAAVARQRDADAVARHPARE